MTSKTNNIFTFLKDYFYVTLGMLLFVLAWAIFLIPNNLIGGGVSGMCSMIFYATGISMGVMNFTINAVLLILAFFVLGRGFGVKTIYAIIISSLAFQFLPGMIPQDFVREFTQNNGKLLCAIFGGVMTGFGIGFAFTHGGSTGGTDIIAMIINKYRNITPGRLLLMMDFVIICSSLLIPSYLQDGTLQPFSEKLAAVIYALIMVAVNSVTVDFYLTGSKQSVQIYIFTKKVDEMSDMIAFELDRGVTLLRSRGWYHKQESEVIMVIARKTDLNEILSKIKEKDSSAFISVTSAMGVYGQGFDSFKGRRRAIAKKKPEL